MSKGIDRLYLNPYQPLLQTGTGVATFVNQQRGAKVASTALIDRSKKSLSRRRRDLVR